MSPFACTSRGVAPSPHVTRPSARLIFPEGGKSAMKFDTSDMVGVAKNVVVMALVAMVLTGSFVTAGVLAVLELALHVAAVLDVRR